MSYEVRVLPFEERFESKENETLLNAALRQNLYLRYGCKHGGCGSCKVRLIDGEVRDDGSSYALSGEERGSGWVLTCMSVPETDCVIDVGESDLTEEEFRAGDQTQSYEALVEEVEALTPDIRRLRLRLDSGSMPFVAGQFVNVQVPGTESYRSYSMANSPADGRGVELIVKVIPGGLFSTYLEKAARAGDRLTLHGPHGLLRVRRSHRQLLMLAGGSGMAPILSILRDLAATGNERPVTFFFGARHAHDLYCMQEVLELGQSMPLEFVPVLSDTWPEGWAGETGLVTDALDRRLRRTEPYDAYLCGAPGMIDAAIPTLLRHGVRERNIYFDAFAPTG